MIYMNPDVSKNPRDEYIWDYGREECGHYLQGCKMGNEYDCFAWDACMLAPESEWSNCVRGCLLTTRIGVGPGAVPNIIGHPPCFLDCWRKVR